MIGAPSAAFSCWRGAVARPPRRVSPPCERPLGSIPDKSLPKDDSPTLERGTSLENPDTTRIRRRMTDTTTDKLITQLRTLHHLTNTEAQIAQTRQVQARDEAVREELATNAANAQERTQLIAATLRDLGGVPDVVTPALGRATALAKTVVEQGQPIAAALVGDLALEHQLLDRARYLEALAETADHADTRNLAR